MNENTTTHDTNLTEFFSAEEMKEILASLESETVKMSFDGDKIDQIKKAWEQVSREKLFKN